MSEVKKSVVTAAAYTGRTWEGQSGTVHYHTIAFADGSTGEYGSMKIEQDKFIIGQETEFTYEPNANQLYAGKIKPYFAQQQAGGGGFSGGAKTNPDRERSIEKQVALKEAMHFAEYTGLKEVETILLLADKFNDWLNPLSHSGLSTAPMESNNPPAPTPQSEPVPGKLPF